MLKVLNALLVRLVAGYTTPPLDEGAKARILQKIHLRRDNQCVGNLIAVRASKPLESISHEARMAFAARCVRRLQGTFWEWFPWPMPVDEVAFEDIAARIEQAGIGPCDDGNPRSIRRLLEGLRRKVFNLGKSSATVNVKPCLAIIHAIEFAIVGLEDPNHSSVVVAMLRVATLQAFRQSCSNSVASIKYLIDADLECAMKLHGSSESGTGIRPEDFGPLWPEIPRGGAATNGMETAYGRRRAA